MNSSNPHHSTPPHEKRELTQFRPVHYYQKFLHLILFFAILSLTIPLRAEEDVILNDILNNPPSPTTTSASSNPAASQPTSLPAELPTAPTRARLATLTLNTNKTITGPAWTTRDSPLRLYQEATKNYRDVDFAQIQKIEVVVDQAVMEPDWRWLKDGSDQKIYSGKSYPNVTLHYKITLLDHQVIEGPLVAPIFILDGPTIRSFILFKKKKGELDQTLQNLEYLKSLTFNSPPQTSPTSSNTPTSLPPSTPSTTHLPLLPD